MAQLREIAVELGDPAAKARLFLQEDDIVTGLGRFHRSRYTRNAAAGDEIVWLSCPCAVIVPPSLPAQLGAVPPWPLVRLGSCIAPD